MSKELIEHDDSRPKITGSPETIWLNYGDIERDDTHQNCATLGEVTWCEEAVFVSDVKYVKADRVEELELHLAKSNDSLGDEMTKNAALLADNERLREAMKAAWVDGYCFCGAEGLSDAQREFQNAIAATPAQSLARIRNQVKDECAKVCESQTEGFAATSVWDEAALSCARAIRAMKEAQ